MKMVSTGSTIRTDGWSGYNDLSKHGYIHEPTNNHNIQHRFTQALNRHNWKLILISAASFKIFPLTYQCVRSGIILLIFNFRILPVDYGP